MIKREIQLIIWGTPTKFYVSDEVIKWIYKGSYDDFLRRIVILTKYKLFRMEK